MNAYHVPGTVNKYVGKLARANPLMFQEKKKQLHRHADKHLILTPTPTKPKSH